MSCAVKGCTNSRRFPKKASSFHTFPRDEVLQKEWLELLSIDRERWTWSKHRVVCSEHFEKGDFFIFSGRRTLRPNSVPCRNLVQVPTSSISNENTLSNSLQTEALSRSLLQGESETCPIDDVQMRKRRRKKRKLDISGNTCTFSSKRRQGTTGKAINIPLSTIIKENFLIKKRREVYRKKLYSAKKTIESLQQEVTDMKIVIQYLMKHQDVLKSIE